MDRAAFPSVAEYLDLLPMGCDSYPECVAKASFLRQALKDKPTTVARGSLPAPIAGLLLSPPPVTAWIPEAHFNAAMFALRDIHFPGAQGREGFRAWTHELAASLYRTQLYRVLFLVMSPLRLLHGVEARWGAFHRGGVDLRCTEASGRRASFRLTYPDFLYWDLSIVGISTSLSAAIEAAGGHDVVVVTQGFSDGATDLAISWR